MTKEVEAESAWRVETISAWLGEGGCPYLSAQVTRSGRYMKEGRGEGNNDDGWADI